MRDLSGMDVRVFGPTKFSSGSYRRGFDADGSVAMHARIVSNESKFVTEGAKTGLVPRLSVFVVVRSLDDGDVSLERAVRSGEQPVRTEAVLDVRANAAVVTVDIAMKSVASQTKTVANVPAPRGSPTKSLNAVGMSVAVAVVSFEVAVMSLALAVKSVDLAVRVSHSCDRPGEHETNPLRERRLAP
jgi:hypothetical protein